MNLTNKRLMPYPKRTNSFLRWSQRLSFFIGVFTLCYVGLVLADAKLYQAYQTWRFNQALKNVSPSIDSREHLPLSPATAKPAKMATLGVSSREGSLLGQIKISAIGLEVMVLEGTQDETLRRAVGHIPGTALPGQAGNVAIAGHRDTFFKPLRNIRKDDEITLTTLSGSHRYGVDSTKVVKPEDIGVLDDTDDAILTLVTCYPFNFVGSAPQRFIVRAHRLDLPAQHAARATR